VWALDEGGGGGKGGGGVGGGDGGGVSISGRCGGLHWSASVISEICLTCLLVGFVCSFFFILLGGGGGH
jgi:hypothetical protein